MKGLWQRSAGSGPAAVIADEPAEGDAPAPVVDSTVSAVSSRFEEAGRLAVTFLVGLGLGAGGVLGYQKVTGVLAGLQPDPLAYVSIIDNGRPIAGYPLKAVHRLEVDTKRPWGMQEFGNVVLPGGPAPLNRDPATRKALRKQILLPPLDPPTGRVIPDVNSITTNALNARSVASNGIFYMVSFIAPPSSSSWLLQNQTIFSDPQMEKDKKTYLAGVFVLYYAPPTSPTGTDWSEQIDTFARQLLPCASHGDPCPLPPKAGE